MTLSCAVKKKLQMCEVKMINLTRQYCLLYPLYNPRYETTVLKNLK